MAISITDEPDALSLAKNQVLYRAETTAYITTPGVPFTTTLFCNPSAAPADGETLIITVLGLDFTYTFKDVPTPGSFFHIDRAGGVLATMNANLYAQLKKNFYLERYYVVTLGIGIVARAAGSEYDLTFTGTAVVAGHMVFVPIASTPEVTEADFNVAWDLYMGADAAGDPEDFIVGQFLRPDADQRVYPDMAELLEKQLSPDIPGYATDLMAYNMNSLRKFMIRYGEYYDGRVNGYESAVAKKVILAGIALERWPFVDFDDTYGAGVAGQKFLTNLSREIVVDRSTQSFLCLLVGAAFEVFADITWDDGTTTAAVPLFSVAGNTKSMAIIPVGFDIHDLISELPVGAEYPVSYEIYVEQGGEESERFKFTIDTFYKINPRRFIFHNSLNGWDTIWCTGDQARSLKNGGDDFEIPTPRTFKPDALESLIVPSNMVNEDKDQVRIFDQNTGYRSKEYVQTLARELPLSNAVFEDTGTEWREIRVDKDSIKEIDADQDDLWSLLFSFTYGLTDKSF